MISNYKKFLIDKLLESVMIGNADFMSILGSIDNSISNELYHIIRREVDIKTNYNLVGVSDKNDEITFIPDSQYQRFKEKGENPWTKTKSKSKIGRMVRQVLLDNGHIFSDSQIEDFVNSFKAEWDKRNSTSRKVSVVTGDDILYWYNIENYAATYGTLGNSCMRFTEKNEYMKLYSNNPDKISMVILTENDKLLARALLWKLDESSMSKSIYLDRIYHVKDSDSNYVYDWVVENIAKGDKSIFASYGANSRSSIDGGKMICNLKNVKFDKYPYADSFFCLYKKMKDGKLSDGGFISNVESVDMSFLPSILRETDGRESIYGYRYSKRIDVYIISGDAAYIRSIDDYIYKKDATFCDYVGEWFLENEICYSEIVKSWIPKRISIDHPKYGIIPNDIIVSVAVKYIGKETTPIGIFLDRNENSYQFEDRIKDSNDHFRTNTFIEYFDISFRVLDLWGNVYPYFICAKLYNIKISSDEFRGLCKKFGIPYYDYNRIIKITKETSDFYGIPIEEKEEFLYIKNYIDNFEASYYFKYIDTKDEIKVSDEIKDRYNELIESMHKYLYLNNRTYKREINDGILDKNIKNEKYKLFKEAMVDSVKETLDSIIPSNLDRLMKRSLRRFGEISIEENKMILDLVPLCFSLYLIYYRNYRIVNELRSYLENLPNLIKKDRIQIISEATTEFVLDELRNSIEDKFMKNCLEQTNKLGIKIDYSDFVEYLLRGIDMQKLFDLYSDLLK